MLFLQERQILVVHPGFLFLVAHGFRDRSLSGASHGAREQAFELVDIVEGFTGDFFSEVLMEFSLEMS